MIRKANPDCMTLFPVFNPGLLCYTAVYIQITHYIWNMNDIWYSVFIIWGDLNLSVKLEEYTRVFSYVTRSRRKMPMYMSSNIDDLRTLIYFWHRNLIYPVRVAFGAKCDTFVSRKMFMRPFDWYKRHAAELLWHIVGQRWNIQTIARARFLEIKIICLTKKCFFPSDVIWKR